MPDNLHKTVEHFSMFGLTTHMSPPGLYVYANDFLEAAKSASPAVPTWQPAKLYLACHSLELAFKAFLSLKGLSLERLSSREFGHNLSEVYRSADEAGLESLVDISDREVDEIRKASRYYNGKVLEYPSLPESVNGYSHAPNLEILLGVASKVVPALKDACLAV